MKVSDRLDGLPIGRFHYRLLLLSGFGWLFDAMDSGLVSFILPGLRDEWNLSSPEIGYTGSAALLGMFLGGAVSGYLSDRYGRKAVFQWTLLVFTLATGLCALAWGFWSLFVLRLIVGFGLGGELPVAAALVSEFAPSRHRGRLIVLLESFWAFGWLAAALIAAGLAGWAASRGIPFPWRWAFLIGALPALYIFVLRRALPESPRFLVARGRVAEAERILTTIEDSSGVTRGEALSPEPPPALYGRWGIFAPALARRTIMLWILWFTMAFSYYGIFVWLPTLLVDQGHGTAKSFQFTLYITLAQVPGYFTAAYLVEKLGRKATLGSFMLLCAISSYFFGGSESAGQILLWGCMVSFFNLGAWGVTYGYTPELYPTHLRGSGTGSAAAFGRIGAFLAPAVVGWMIAGAGGGFGSIFTLFAGVLVIGALAVLLLGEETQGRTLEQISG